MTSQSVNMVTEHLPGRSERVVSLDLLRGLVIAIMALDNVHDFFGDLTAQPTNLATTTAALFLTRWITHICAPVFSLLTGTGAYLARARMSKPQLSRFLLGRGLWLIVLELVVMRFALQFNFDYQTTIITVLWALGWSMLTLAGLIWLPLWAVILFGVVLVAGHNALDGIDATTSGRLAPLWTVLHAPGVLINTGRSVVVVSYVLIPWVGVAALGYALGAIYRWSPARRQKLLSCLGWGLIAMFIVLRFVNIYGDPARWSRQDSLLWTAMSFVNTTKYPPSLLFLLMTLGPALLLLRLFDAKVPGVFGPLVIIGKVPLFFYVVHFYLIHLLAVAASYIRYGKVAELFQSPDLGHFPFSQPPGWDVGVPMVYLLWLAVLVIMFPLCRWYAQVKRTGHYRWLSYL
ncbi:MAG TPA: heparan-alpha-glucosaminide N-acetyltransferase domain-containing protein [Steroidobacteraceae bacterium]